MKFLVTGKLQSNEGPRRVMVFAIAFILLFTLAHAAREFYATGYAPATVKKNLYRAASGKTGFSSPRSPLMVLEDLHIDLFLYSIVFLLLASLLLQARIHAGLRRGLIGLLFIMPLLYAAARMLTVYVAGFAYVVGLFSITLHLSITLSALLILRDLFGPSTRGPA